MFRGTYADGTSDWKRNLQATQIKVPLPPALLDEDSVADPNDTTNVCFFHQGCFEYLFRNCDRGPSYPKERYEEVLTNILAVLEQYPDYKVFIAGHSLGGALALLVSFYASADPRIPKPITCVSVGSLLIGDDHFRQAFEKSEALGWIRHLRITNDNDPVPYLPPFSWYRPVGMHLRLNQQEGFSISHATSSVLSSSSPPKENTMSSWRLFWNAFQSRLSLEKFVEPHNIPEYLRRMEREKEHLVGIHLNALYRDPNIVGKDFKTRL